MRAQPPDLGVAVSNGFHKMHLATAAREANDRGFLKLLVTGAYPTPAFRRLLRALPVRGPARLRRLEHRGEDIPLERVQVLFLPELLEQLARGLARVPLLRRLSEKLIVATYRLYGRKAARALVRAQGAQIYHFRAGTKAALEDLDRSDAVVVSSPFVKETFMRVGWTPERVHVAYTGIDENFFHYGELPVPRRSAPSGPLPLLFASVLSRRKGAKTLVEALELVGSRIDWDLVVAGPVGPDIAAKHRSFFADPRVEVLGNLARPQFKAQLIARGVFPFPSNAEGSARAVWEALACGCYVITTPNAGSIVEDGVHGALVPPGDADALAEAIVAADSDRERIAEIGNRNAELIASSYRQSAYGDALTRIYADLAQGEGHTSSVPPEVSAPRIGA
jgi:glycosyltransferase involved in cell wall biosynthesis